MSINSGTPPSYAPPGLECLTCFPPGHTPADFYIALAAIDKGVICPPGAPTPPNGLHLTTVIGAGHWQLIDVNLVLDYELTNTDSIVEADDGGLYDYFWQDYAVTCEISFDNFFNDPLAFDYYGGWATCWHLGDAGPGQIGDILELVGVEPADETWVNPRPRDTGETVFVISRASDATNIHVLFEHP